MAKKLHLVHVKSNVLDKAPSASTLNYGEIAVNYNAESPALYIKDDEDNIVKFISEPYFLKIVGTGVTENDGETITPISEIIQQDELTVSSALNDLNDRKADKSYVDSAISSVTIDVDTELDSASTNPVENRVITQVILDNEETVAAALNDLNDRKADKEYVDEAVSSITIDVDSELDTASTNPVENRVITQAILDNEETVAAALNDLNDRKADKEYVDEVVSSITIDVDSELDSASTNPVENQAITNVLFDVEETVAAALNDLNSRKADKDYVDEAVSSITIDVDSELDSASTNPVENQAITNALLDVEETVAAALNDLNDRKADISYVDEAVSSITIDIDSELDSASTNPLENRAIYAILEEDEQAIAAALNDLNDRKADKDYVDAAVSAVTIDVDDEISSGSSNPVENRVIYQALWENEIVVAGALNDLNNKIAITGVTETGSGNVITDAYLEDGVLNIEFGELHKISKTGSYNDLVDAPTNLEVTTNKVTAITSTNTNTQYASAKATYDEIHPAIITTGGDSATITVEPNVLYRFGTLTGTKTFALATPGDSSVVNHYYWTFDTSTTTPTITWPSGLTWYGGSAPTLSVSKHYEISVINGIAISMEV